MKLSYPKSRRMPELDALRGLFLVWMTFTHMPTRFSDLCQSAVRVCVVGGGFCFYVGAAGKPGVPA